MCEGVPLKQWEAIGLLSGLSAIPCVIVTVTSEAEASDWCAAQDWVREHGLPLPRDVTVSISRASGMRLELSDSDSEWE